MQPGERKFYSMTPEQKTAFQQAKQRQLLYGQGWSPEQAAAFSAAGGFDALGGYGGGAGGAGAGGPGAGAGAGAAGAYENVAGYQPDIRYALDALKARAEGDLGAGRATDVAVGKLRELGIGLDKETTAQLARSGGLGAVGVGGIGAEGLARQRNRERLERAAAGVATDISLGREAQRDEILRSIMGGGAELGRLGISERALNLQQQTDLDRNLIAREAAAQAQLAGMLRLIGGFGAGGFS